MLRLSLTALAVISLFGCSSDASAPLLISHPSQETVEHGKQLVKGLAACGACHGETASPQAILAGGRHITDQYGPVQVPNITPARTGIGDWQDKDIVRAIRASVSPSEQWLSAEAHRGYEWMADEDVLSIVAYLRSLPPIEKQVERRALSFVDRNTKGFFDSRNNVAGFIPSIDPKATQEYGQYLTDHVARCGGCHNSPASFLRDEEYLVGGKTIRIDQGEKVAPAITSSKVFGLGDWKEEAIVRYLKTGETPDGNVVDSAFCPVGFFRNAPESDLVAIARYLRTVQ